MIRVATPSIIMRETIDGVEVYFSVIPPIITSSKFIERLKESLDLNYACDNIPKAECFSLIFGGVTLSKKGFIENLPVYGYLTFNKGKKLFNVEEFLNNPYDCFYFKNEDDGVCITKTSVGANSKFIDNIGVRAIIY